MVNTKRSKKKRKPVKRNLTKRGKINYAPFILSFQSKLNQKNVEDNLDKIIMLDLKLDPKIFSPLSGSELPYEPDKWNVPKHKNNNNCYSYATSTLVSKREGKPQPGYFSHHAPISENEYKDCKNFYRRIKKDIPLAYAEKFTKPCKKGFYKAFMAIDNKDGDKDYHFWRQDNTGYWSHKPGTTEVVNVDSDGKVIINPLLANRKYKYYNYKKPCFFFCTPKNGAKVTSKSIYYGGKKKRKINKN